MTTPGSNGKNPPWRTELLPGALVALLTLPQAIALAALAGMPFEAGIYLSLIPALAATLASHSPISLSGPNTAASLLLMSSASVLATPGESEYIQQVLITTLFAGAFQLLLAIFRIGDLLLEVPETTTRGVLAGTGVLIVAAQGGPLLGVPVNGNGAVEAVEQAIFFDAPSPGAFAIGAISIAVGAGLQASGRRRYSLLAALLAGWLAAEFIDVIVGSANARIERLGAVRIGIDFISWPAVGAADITHMLAAVRDGFAIAVVGALQTAVTARILALRSGASIGINRDIAAQGLMNVLAAFTSGFAGATSFNRSLANAEVGATGRQAGIYGVLFLGAGTLMAGPLLARIPLPAVAGVLVLVGGSLIVSARNVCANRRGYRTELVMTALAAVFLGLLSAVVTGALIAVYFRALRKTTGRRENDATAEASDSPCDTRARSS